MVLLTVRWTICVLLLVFTTGASDAVALTLADTPDVYSSFISVSYDHLSGAFSASGYALTLDALDITDGTFNIGATISTSGVASSGWLSIGGSVAGLGISGPTLLAGILTDFDFVFQAGSPFEFSFLISEGGLTNLFGGVGATAGVILTQTGFGGTFASDFSTSFGAVSDTAPVAPVPEPSTLLLALGGGAVYVVRRLRRHRSLPESL